MAESEIQRTPAAPVPGGAPWVPVVGVVVVMTAFVAGCLRAWMGPHDGAVITLPP